MSQHITCTNKIKILEQGPEGPMFVTCLVGEA